MACRIEYQEISLHRSNANESFRIVFSCYRASGMRFIVIAFLNLISFIVTYVTVTLIFIFAVNNLICHKSKAEKTIIICMILAAMQWNLWII